LHRGLGHCASLWPCSWQRSHASSLGQPCCICASFPHEWRTLTVWDTLTHRMACCVACSAHSVWVRTYRAQRTVILARCVTCSVRFRSTVGANHRVCDPMMIRFRSLLIRFLYAAALLGPPLPGPYLLTQRPCLDLRCQALTYVLTYVAAMNGNRRQWMFRIDPICFFVSVIKIPGRILNFG
jgi:hypothetical protein